MPNHLAQKKSMKQDVVRRLRNRARISRVKTFIKKFDESIKSNASNFGDSFTKAQSEIMKSVSRGIIKKKTASRKVARLHKRLNSVSV